MCEIIKRAGGRGNLARATGVQKSTPHSWTRLPAHHVVKIAALIDCEPWQLRPDVFPRPVLNEGWCRDYD